jgi:hypothetical protein
MIPGTKIFYMCFLIMILSLNEGAYEEYPPGLLTISGYFKDAASGETLVGATVFVKETNTGTSSNQ